MPGDRGNSNDERHTRDERNAIPTTSRRWWAATELERFDLGTHDVDGYDGEVVDDVDEEEDASQADDGSMQIVEAWVHSSRAYEDLTVYFRPVKYDNGEGNAMASDSSKAKTVL
jgi:hypothetical protein